MGEKINVGIGFATGRKSFQTILKTNIYNWRESGLTDEKNISLNLFVAYDLKYSNTKISDYTNMSKELQGLIDSACFIGTDLVNRETKELIDSGVLTESEARFFFGNGYAAKRNAILYFAMKKKIDYLIFLDDDEYPMAVTESASSILWSGQNILQTHLQHINNADITYGRHCGYISPIPQITFNEMLTEEDFRMFIEAISNDIINWDTIKLSMGRGGVTYADKKILETNKVEEVEEINGAKFISGSNLCINLTKPERIYPFFNPPQARGEDTFLGTCLGNRKVLRMPCYAFHDAFSRYKPLLNGVLPIILQKIKTNSPSVVNRFYKACIGWIRYKPLLLYITDPSQYDSKISKIREQLTLSLPKICNYFDNTNLMNVLAEMERYNRNVKTHYSNFISTQQIWSRLVQNLS